MNHTFKKIALLLLTSISTIHSYIQMPRQSVLTQAAAGSDPQTPPSSNNNDYLKRIGISLGFMALTSLPAIVKFIRHEIALKKGSLSQVGVLEIKGDITDSTYYVKHLKKFFENPRIKAVILKIESPGGQSGGAKAIFDELMYLKEKYKKPVLTISENIMASAAYWIAAGSDYILTSPTTLVGSIGVITMRYNIKDLLKFLKINLNVYAKGKYKTTLHQTTAISPEQELLIESLNQDVYDQFTKDVAQARMINLDERETWAEGKIYTGKQALDLHLIDAVGSWSTFIPKLKELAKITGNIEWVYPKKSGFFEPQEQNVIPESNSLESRMINGILTTIENRYFSGIRV